MSHITVTVTWHHLTFTGSVLGSLHTYGQTRCPSVFFMLLWWHSHVNLLTCSWASCDITLLHRACRSCSFSGWMWIKFFYRDFPLNMLPVSLKKIYVHMCKLGGDTLKILLFIFFWGWWLRSVWGWSCSFRLEPLRDAMHPSLHTKRRCPSPVTVSLLVKTAGTLESNLWKLCLQCLTVSTTMHEKNKMKYK